MADFILLTLPDGGGVSPPTWSSGDRPDVITTVAGYIQAFDPEAIVTFDPRHGTTCHPDHRATANIVLEAAKRLSAQPKVYLLETKVSVTTDPFSIRFASGASSAERYDANNVLTSTNQPAWNAVVEDMQRHPSQFDQRWITAIQNVPPSERSVFLAQAEAVLQQPADTCP